MSDYSVIVGMHAGGDWFPHLITSIRNQSVQPKKIIVWVNPSKEHPFVNSVGTKLEIIYCSENYGVYSRFTAGLLCDTDRILILDDDTLPGKDWAKNCFNTIERVGDESIIGYRGIRLLPNALYDIEAYQKGTNEITEVDLCGHSWFVKRKHILAMFEDQPVNKFNGEDTHLSASNQIKYGTKTYIPAQPLTKPQDCGSTMQQLGALPGRLSTSLGPTEHFAQREKVNKHWISKGWKTFYERARISSL